VPGRFRRGLPRRGGQLRRWRHVHQPLARLHQALAIGAELADKHVQAITFGNLGETYRLTGRLDDAARYFRRGLDRCREMGYPTAKATALHNLGETYRGLGRLTDAAERYREALAIRRKIGNRLGEANTLTGPGETLVDLGRAAEARAYWREALAIYRSIGAPPATTLAARLAGS
jgi:tetratricopeptide (TPR) repeat protein